MSEREALLFASGLGIVAGAEEGAGSGVRVGANAAGQAPDRSRAKRG
ncbi:MAG: hypothetical protein NVV62_19085 [Terricaulis sp.]|nr:hypothetical protein [Terricaulis sp.]